MINTALLRPRNLIVIGLIAAVWHIIAGKVYAKIDGGMGPTGDDNS